jgi:hypothetical protein
MSDRNLPRVTQTRRGETRRDSQEGGVYAAPTVLTSAYVMSRGGLPAAPPLVPSCADADGSHPMTTAGRSDRLAPSIRAWTH